ncbi:uncharacterized protein [Triticum aestivum]|uniref:uncharacterized protein n=1 Tax=Triticum aestivum TaxID=4565 RepID=UPI001D028723|nr:uncharacterized protein LOC123135783 [Triticum aestivum]
MLPSNLHPRSQGALGHRSGSPAGRCVQATSWIGRAACHPLLMDLRRLRLRPWPPRRIHGGGLPVVQVFPSFGPSSRSPPPAARPWFLPRDFSFKLFIAKVCGEDTNLGSSSLRECARNLEPASLI